VVCALQDYPSPNDVEYYYDDKHDPKLKSRVDKDYGENYDEEMKKAASKESSQEMTAGAYMPELRDYTLKTEFRDPFKTMPQVASKHCCFLGPNLTDGCGIVAVVVVVCVAHDNVEFENYNNSCWPDSILHCSKTKWSYPPREAFLRRWVFSP